MKRLLHQTPALLNFVGWPCRSLLLKLSQSTPEHTPGEKAQASWYVVGEQNVLKPTAARRANATSMLSQAYGAGARKKAQPPSIRFECPAYAGQRVRDLVESALAWPK